MRVGGKWSASKEMGGRRRRWRVRLCEVGLRSINMQGIKCFATRG